MAKGFRGKYFSLAAIQAVSSAAVLTGKERAFSARNDLRLARSDDREEESPEDSAPPTLGASCEEGGAGRAFPASRSPFPFFSPFLFILPPRTFMTHPLKRALAVTGAWTLLTLPLAAYDLETLTVTADKGGMESGRFAGTVEILSGEELAAKGYTDLAQALSALPGLSLAQNGGQGSVASLFLRGAANQRTLVLLDGVRFNDPSSFSGAEVAHLPLYSVERIEIVKGPMSGVWGADAAAGVINIITKKGESKGGAVTATAGSYGQRTFSATLNGGEPDLYANLAFSRTTMEGFSVTGSADDNEKDGYGKTSLSVNVGAKAASGVTLEAGLTAVDALAHYDGYGEPDAELRSIVNDRLSHMTLGKTAGNHALALKLTHATFRREEPEATYGVYRYRGTAETVELTDKIRYGEASHLTLALQQESFAMDYLSVGAPGGERSRIDNAAALSNLWTLGRWSFTQSLRHDSFNDFGDQTTGRLGVAFAEKGYRLYAAAATAYNAPAMTEMANPWGTPNPDLEAEKSQSLEVGGSWAGLKAAFFDNKVTDLIQWTDLTGTPLDWSDDGYENSKGESRLKGYELSWSGAALPRLEIGLDHSVLWAEDADGVRLARRPAAVTGLELDWTPGNAYRLSTRMEYIGDRIDNAATGVQTGHYALVRLSGDAMLDDTWNLNLTVENLLDREYETVAGYNAPGRELRASVSARF